MRRVVETVPKDRFFFKVSDFSGTAVRYTTLHQQSNGWIHVCCIFNVRVSNVLIRKNAPPSERANILQ